MVSYLFPQKRREGRGTGIRVEMDRKSRTSTGVDWRLRARWLAGIVQNSMKKTLFSPMKRVCRFFVNNFIRGMLYKAGSWPS